MPVERLSASDPRVQAALQGKRRSKYGNVRTTVDGITFDSAKEARRWQELKLLEKAGQIERLSRQDKWPLVVREQQLGVYVSDFRYRVIATRTWITEDCKGVRTPLYLWKRAHMKAQYGIDIFET